MPSIFDRVDTSQSAIRKTADWFKSKVRSLQLLSTSAQVGYDSYSNPLKGFMYFFFYEAKHRRTLEYWDRFPLVLPFNIRGNRMWGLNFHYLPYNERVLLFASLDKLIRDSNIEEQKKFHIGWQLIGQFGRLKLAKPCVHQYILSPQYVKSKFLHIDSDEWITALLMPNEQFYSHDPKVGDDIDKFVKKSKQEVWKDSLIKSR